MKADNQCFVFGLVGPGRLPVAVVRGWHCQKLNAFSQKLLSHQNQLDKFTTQTVPLLFRFKVFAEPNTSRRSYRFVEQTQFKRQKIEGNLETSQEGSTWPFFCTVLLRRMKQVKMSRAPPGATPVGRDGQPRRQTARLARSTSSHLPGPRAATSRLGEPCPSRHPASHHRGSAVPRGPRPRPSTAPWAEAQGGCWGQGGKNFFSEFVSLFVFNLTFSLVSTCLYFFCQPAGKCGRVHQCCTKLHYSSVGQFDVTTGGMSSCASELHRRRPCAKPIRALPPSRPIQFRGVKTHPRSSRMNSFIKYEKSALRNKADYFTLVKTLADLRLLPGHRKRLPTRGEIKA